MADNETSYLPIGTCLEQIEQAVYGREVRKAIHDGIAQCYDDTVEGVNAAQQAASDTQDVIDNAVTATNAANTAAAEASNVKVEQTVSGDTVTFTTTKRDGSTVSTSFQKPNIVVSKDEGSGEFSVTAKGWNGEEIVATIPDPSEEVKSRATIAAVSKVKTALGNPLTITDGMDAPAVKTVVTLEPKQDLHGYDHPWVGGAGKNLIVDELFGGVSSITVGGVTMTVKNGGFHLEGSSGTDSSTRRALKTKEFTLKAGTYTFSKSASDNIIAAIQPANAASSYIALAPADTRKTYTFSEDMTVVFGVNAVLNTTYNTDIHVQLEAGDTATTYEPYSNICPIEGYDTVRVTATGKNLYTGALKILSHSINVSGTYNYDSAGCVTEYIPVKGADVIKWGIEVYPVSGRGRRLHAYDQYGNWLRQLDFFTSVNDGNRLRTVTLTEDVAYVRLSLHVDDVYAFIYTDQSITEFIKDEGSTTSLSVAQAAGATVYGGTVTLNEDGSGTLVVDRVKVVITEATSGLQYDTSNRLYIPAIAMLGIKGATSSNDVADATSNQFACVTTNGTYNNTMEGFAVAPSGACYLYSSKFASLDAWKTYLQANNLEIEGALATPATYTLTASQLRTLTGENHVWTDGTKLELTYRADKYADVEKFLNAIPTGTKTGDPAVFADGADDLPFEKLTIAVEPHQEGSGDPSPDNVRPITGWDEVKVTRCGKNLLDANKVGTVTTGAGTRQGIEFTQPGIYTISAQNGYSDSTSTIYVTVYDGTSYSSGSPIIVGEAKYSSFSKTITDGQRLIVHGGAGIGASKTVDAINVCQVQLEYGSTATIYEPFKNVTTLPISLKYATGSTVYGGTVTINRDGTGSVVVDRAKVDMGTLTWTYQTSATIQLFRASVTGIKTGGSDMAKLSCPIYKWVPTSKRTNNTISQNYSTNVDVMDSRYTDAASFKAAMSGIPLIYELATPTAYTLTAPQLTSLLGNNTVWCDAGQVTVKYKMDIGKALDAMKASLIEAGLYIDMGGVIVEPGA